MGLFAKLHRFDGSTVANLSLVSHPQKRLAPPSALITACSETTVSNLSGGRSPRRSSAARHKIAHPASSKTGSVTPLPEANMKTPEPQDSSGGIPVQIFVPVGDQTPSRFSEDLSPPPQPPPPSSPTTPSSAPTTSSPSSVLFSSYYSSEFRTQGFSTRGPAALSSVRGIC